MLPLEMALGDLNLSDSISMPKCRSFSGSYQPPFLIFNFRMLLHGTARRWILLHSESLNVCVWVESSEGIERKLLIIWGELEFGFGIYQSLLVASHGFQRG